jgi:hypothetical protein
MALVFFPDLISFPLPRGAGGGSDAGRSGLPCGSSYPLDYANYPGLVQLRVHHDA